MLIGYWGSKDAPDFLMGILVGGCRVPGGMRRSHGLLGPSFEEAPQASPAASQPHLSLLPRAPQLTVAGVQLQLQQIPSFKLCRGKRNVSDINFQSPRTSHKAARKGKAPCDCLCLLASPVHLSKRKSSWRVSGLVPSARCSNDHLMTSKRSS